MKKSIFLIIFLALAYGSYSQGAAGIFDDRRFFFTYMNNGLSKQEILPIETFYPSMNYVAYVNVNGQFKLVVDHKKYTIMPVPPQTIQVSNFLMAYTQGPVLGMFNGKESRTVEGFTEGGFKLGDSILAYVNNYGHLKVYVYDTIYDLMEFADTSRFKVSDNLVAFNTLSDQFKVFYNHAVFDVEDVSPNDFKMGRNIIAYHDYIDNFNVFDRGHKVNLETYRIENYEVSNEFMTYLDNMDAWTVYYGGKKIPLLSTKPKMKLQKRNMLAYSDNAGNFFTFYKGKVWQLENYTPAKFDIWDDLLVYEDMYRVLWGVYKGKKIKISKGVVRGEWSLQNRCVVYWDLTPNTMTVWNDGNLYQYSEVDDPNRR